MFSAFIKAADVVAALLPPKKESGVAFIMPITTGCSKVIKVPLQFSVNIASIQLNCNQFKDIPKMLDTNTQYNEAVAACKEIFIKKTKDYGTAWRVLRTISVVDQIFIKALRIRTIQELKTQKVGDDIRSEFIGILNYAIIGLIQLELGNSTVEELAVDQTEAFYLKQVQFAQDTMQSKNHDYGEAWREMSQESFADLILVKLLRIKQILQNDGKTLISEGIDANYVDIINYAAFALILIQEGKH
jgi:hypothetical protein